MVEKIPEQKLEKVKEYHSHLSKAYGVNVGFGYKGTVSGVIDIIREKKETQQVNFRSTLLQFLRAKDDNMILLMTGLLHQLQQNHLIWAPTEPKEEQQSNLTGLKSLLGLEATQSKQTFVDVSHAIGDLFGQTTIDKDISVVNQSGFHQNQSCLNIVFNLL